MKVSPSGANIHNKKTPLVGMVLGTRIHVKAYIAIYGGPCKSCGWRHCILIVRLKHTSIVVRGGYRIGATVVIIAGFHRILQHLIWIVWVWLVGLLGHMVHWITGIVLIGWTLECQRIGSLVGWVTWTVWDLRHWGNHMWHWSRMCRDAAGMMWVFGLLAAPCWLANWPVLFWSSIVHR